MFSHLGKVLFSHMKEAMFADDPLVEEDEEGEDGSDDEESKEEVATGVSLCTERRISCQHICISASL